MHPKIKCYVIPDRDRAALDHLAHRRRNRHGRTLFMQHARNRQVADAGVGIDLGRGATHDALDDLQPRRGPIAISASEQIELMPGRPALDVEIAAEAQRIDRRARGVLQRGDRGEVDDRTHLARDVGEAVAVRHAAPSAGRAARRRRTRAKNASIAARPSGGAQVAARGLAILGADASACGSVVEAVRSSASRAFRISSGTGAWAR